VKNNIATIATRRPDSPLITIIHLQLNLDTEKGDQSSEDDIEEYEESEKNGKNINFMTENPTKKPKVTKTIVS